MIRVARPGGTIAVLEFSKPTMFGLKQVYNAYFQYVLPNRPTMAKNDRSAYE